MIESSSERTRWTIHGEPLVDENSHVRLSIASVELPNGATFEQYVFRMRRCAMTVVRDDAYQNILLIWRHRFIVDQWDWEVPGGYVDPGEDGVAAAAREAEEETGWRPRDVKFLLSYQPMAGSADAPQDIYGVVIENALLCTSRSGRVGQGVFCVLPPVVPGRHGDFYAILAIRT